MRARSLLLAAVCDLAPLKPPAQESPDWLPHLYRPYLDHLCWIGDYSPEDLGLPWEDVAWGRFEFQFIRSIDCGSACGSIGCSPAGELFGTLSLYAESTAAPRDSWSAIKSGHCG
jgi:hypothetical protein